MTTKITTDNIASETLTTILGPKVSSIVYPGDDTAANTAGGDSITLLGSGFNNGASVIINGTSAGVVTVVSSTQITFTAPAQSAGTYVIYVINSDGGTAISIPGISYSGTPNWSTSAGSVGNVYETASINTTLTATGDAPITYSVVSGTLPAGSTLNSSTGLLSGTASATASSTTYNFTVKASDAQNQDTNRAFSITLNPDVVTWSSPANNTSYSVNTNTAIANVGMSASSAASGSITYTADTLPTGLSITGANIAGTPTVVANTTTILTATATSTRSATRTINWVVTVANDTYWKNTTLLLNGETTVTPFISDSSANSFGLVINGDTKPTLFNPYQGDGYYSVNFPGSSSLSTASIANLSIGTSDFTIELWAMPQVLSDALCVFITSNNSAMSAPVGFLLRLSSTTGWQLIVGNGSSDIYNSTASFATYGGGINVWTHHAIVRSSGTLRWYVNGVQAYSVSDSTAYNQTYLAFGNYASYYWNGYISNFRIVKGTGIYTSAFTPPTTPLTAVANTSVLVLQSNRFIDKSTNAISLISAGTPTISPNIPFTPNSSYSTYGSTYFDGTGDSLTIPTNSAGNFGTSPFTLEFWMYSTDAATSIIQQDTNGTPNWAILITSGNLYWQNGYQANSLYYLSLASLTTNPLVNAWTHIAITRDSSDILKWWVNGVGQTAYGTDTTNYNSTSAIKIGSGGYGEYTGYLSNLRIVKGTAVYTSNFTPPTTPLTAIANTSLLTLQYNGGANNYGIIDNGPFNNIITRSGNTSQGSFSPYSVTGWSNYFNGSTGYITSANSTNNSLGSGDYTIEFWCYSNSLGSGSAGCMFYVDHSGYQQMLRHNGSVWECYYKSGVAFSTVSTSTVGINQWVHHALVRYSGTVKWYINGVQYGSASDSTNFSSSTFFQSGMFASYFYDGYVSNVRVVKGTAVYTAAFTPPTAPLTSIAGTVFLTAQSNRFIDNGPNNNTLTITSTPSTQAFGPFGSISEATPISYSNYFDGTGDYLQIPHNSALDLGSGNFTVEFWLNAPVWSSGTAGVIGKKLSDGTSGWQIYRDSNQPTKLNGRLGGSNNFFTTSTVTAGQWEHWALVRTGSTVYWFKNGVLDATTTNNVNVADVTASFNIAVADTWIAYGQFYLSNVRVVKGTAVYTGNFTPSTTPLTAIANTSLLTCQSTRIIDNSTNAFTITANGDTKPKPYNPFGYTAQSETSYTPSIHGGSVYLDGTGDNLTTPDNAFDLTTTTWSIEYWIYPTTISSGYYGLWALSTSGFRHGIYTDSGTHYLVVLNGGGGYGNFDLRAANKVITLNNWQHVALTSDGTTIRQFYNGVQTSTGTAASFSASTPTIGSWGGANYFAGYMSGFRITKGSAVYTSNFVPPTQALSNYSTTYPATLLLNFNNGGIVDQHSSNVLETVGNAQISTSIKKYNNGSIYFDGTGDYLYGAPNINYAMGSGDFTIEFWYYPITHTNTNPTIISTWNTTWATNKWGLHAPHQNNANKYSFWVYNYSSAVAMLVSTSNVTDGAWVHIAISRSGSTWKLFINGTSEASVTSSVALDAGTAASMDGLWIGANFYSADSGRYINAYIDDLRITKGYARYTATFTAPTSALITK